MTGFRSVFGRSLIALLLVLSFFSPVRARAEMFQLPSLDTSMTDPIFRTLAAGFAFRPMEPASDLGRIWGFYFGLSGSATDSSAVSSIFSSMSSSYVPSADLQIGIGLPMGVTLELGVLPNLSYNGTAINKYEGRLKWTATRTLLKKLPFNAALALGYAKTAFSYSQPLNSGTVTVKYGSDIVSLMFLMSKSIGFSYLGFEPYAGAGLANASSTISGSGTANLFGSSFPTGTATVSAGQFTPWLQAGLLLRLGIFGITGEYDYLFALSSWNVKASMRF